MSVALTLHAERRWIRAGWRLTVPPLVGDDLGVPIPADDALREFEEVGIGAWDPGMDPVEGDFRIRLGRCTGVPLLPLHHHLRPGTR